jgi:hypothetical protein
MDSERQPSLRSKNVPWNKGRLTGRKRPLKPKDVWAIRVRLQLEHRKRDLALFSLAIDSKLRGCDLVRLQLNDVCAGGRVRDRATVIQKKTGRPVQFEITEQTRAAIQDWLARVDARNGDYIFPSRFRAQPHLSTRQYARIVHYWVESAGLDSSAYGTHSMRRTRQRKSIRRQVTSERFSFCLDIQSSKARSAISVSRSMTRSAFPSRSSCKLNRRGRGSATSGATMLGQRWLSTRPPTGRYRCTNPPFDNMPVNREVGWIPALQV